MTISAGGLHEHREHVVRGWFSDKDKEWYKGEAKKIKNGKILEIGVYGGVSLLTIAEICQENKTEIIGIEPWELNTGDEAWNSEGNLIKLRKNLEKIVDELKYNHINLVQDYSVSYSKNIPDGSLDLVFVDGCHEFNSVYGDMHAYYPKLKEGGVLAGHDYTERWPGVKQAVRKFSKFHKLDVELHNKIIWQIKK